MRGKVRKKGNEAEKERKEGREQYPAAKQTNKLFRSFSSFCVCLSVFVHMFIYVLSIHNVNLFIQ